MHVDEDLAHAPVFVFAGAEIDLVAADDGLLRIALAAVGQALAFVAGADALDDLLHDPLGDDRRARGLRLRHQIVELVVVIADLQHLRGERLRQLRAVAIERVGLQRELPGQHIGIAAILDGRVVRHVDRLGDRARDEGLARRHHADMAFDRQRPLADTAARIGAIEHRQVLRLQMRRAFERHRAADMQVGGVDFGLGEAERLEQVEVRRVENRRAETRECRRRIPRPASIC